MTTDMTELARTVYAKLGIEPGSPLTDLQGRRMSAVTGEREDFIRALRAAVPPTLREEESSAIVAGDLAQLVVVSHLIAHYVGIDLDAAVSDLSTEIIRRLELVTQNG